MCSYKKWKMCKVELGGRKKTCMGTISSRKTLDPFSQSYYVLEQWVCAILPCISLLWQHVSSLSVERRRRTRELRVMASTTALKTLTGRRSSVVPLSTIALSMLYWKKGRKSEVEWGFSQFNRLLWKTLSKQKKNKIRKLFHKQRKTDFLAVLLLRFCFIFVFTYHQE